MAAKRLIDQDPEYEPIPMEIQEKRMKFIERDACNATVKKIESILRSQFGPEISNKAKEVDTVDDMLHEARQMLDRLRACIVRKYFCEAGNKDVKSEESNAPSIHPTVKEYFMGKSPKFGPGVVVKTEPEERAAAANSAVDETSQNLSSVSSGTNGNSETGNSINEAAKENEVSVRAPRIKTKCKFIVGNVSKFLPLTQRDEDDQSTHKWMVYVRGDKDSPSVDGVVKKVIFLLHSSYRPNDIVEVCNPPFQLVKRGWGEFIIRVQLHFKDPLNKPVDIFHHLKLDKTYTGLQTLGAETVAELTLYKPEDKVISKPSPISSSPGPSSTFQTVPANICNNTIPAVPNFTSTHNENSKDSSQEMNITLPPEKIKKEKEEMCISSNSPSIVSPSKVCDSSVRSEPTYAYQLVPSPVKAAPIAVRDKVKSPVAAPKLSPVSKQIRPVNQPAKNQLTNGVGTFIKCTDSQGRILLVPQASLICMGAVNNNAAVKPFTITQTVMQPQCSSSIDLGKNVVHNVAPTSMQPNAKLPSYVLKVIPTVQSRPSQVLLIPVSEGAQKTQPVSSSQHMNNASVSTVPSSQQQNITNTGVVSQSPAKRTKNLLHWEHMVESLRIESCKSFLEFLKKMVKIFPLISQDYDPSSIPFCASSVEVFQSWNIGKQRAAEWQRAGMVRFLVLKLLNTRNTLLKTDDVWSRREIMIWCRKNGYTPPLRVDKIVMPQVDSHAAPTVTEISSVTEAKSIIANLEESQNTGQRVDDEDEDEEVDILSIPNEDQHRSEKLTPNLLSRDCVPPSSLSALHVKESAAEIGVKLKPLEVEPLIYMPVIEEMILVACKEFASDLIRSSLVQGYNRMGGKLCPEEVTVLDVFNAIQNTDTFDFVTHKYLGVLQEPLDQS